MVLQPVSHFSVMGTLGRYPFLPRAAIASCFAVLNGCGLFSSPPLPPGDAFAEDGAEEGAEEAAIEGGIDQESAEDAGETGPADVEGPDGVDGDFDVSGEDGGEGDGIAETADEEEVCGEPCAPGHERCSGSSIETCAEDGCSYEVTAQCATTLASPTVPWIDATFRIRPCPAAIREGRDRKSVV